jgi:hypothetical protein
MGEGKGKREGGRIAICALPCACDGWAAGTRGRASAPAACLARTRFATTRWRPFLPSRAITDPLWRPRPFWRVSSYAAAFLSTTGGAVMRWLHREPAQQLFTVRTPCSLPGLAGSSILNRLQCADGVHGHTDHEPPSSKLAQRGAGSVRNRVGPRRARVSKIKSKF